MRIGLSERFQADVAALGSDARARLLDVILALPLAFREPQRHVGAGLRKIHASGIWEARLGLDLRLVMTLSKNEVVLLRIGSHDDVRRFLRTL